VRLSDTLGGLATYPFVRLTEAKRAAAERGADVIDFGMGEPREETPDFIRRAVAAAVEAEPVSAYPLAEGLPETREAIAAWVARRFGVGLDPGTEIVPTLGSKELIFHLAQVVGGEAVAVTVPGYPVPERGARFADREVVELPLSAEGGWLPELPGPEVLSRLAILWVNSPNNPTGAVAPLEWLERAAALAREHDFVLACDEAYSELYFGDPPPSGLQLRDRTNVLALNTLSKRSSMPGYRIGFAAGDPAIVAALKRYRPNVGVAPQSFVQRAGAVAWGDEDHVVEVRARYAEKRAILLPALEAAGFRHVGGDASFFLWLTVPGSSEAVAMDLLDRLGIVVAPGAYFGAAGEGHVRLALVPTVARCREAAERLAGR
jgi:acetylornithine aminotransferase